MSPTQWCTRINAKDITSSKGKYSIGTFAHSDMALEFASWIDNLFKLYLIKEFKRLKYNESYQNEIEWSVGRSVSKTNYKVHTGSIKNAVKNPVKPKLMCSSKNDTFTKNNNIGNRRLSEKIGLITADEAMAGGIGPFETGKNTNSYLYKSIPY